MGGDYYTRNPVKEKKCPLIKTDREVEFPDSAYAFLENEKIKADREWVMENEERQMIINKEQVDWAVNIINKSDEIKKEIINDILPSNEKLHDPVNHPSHYMNNGIETIDVLRAWLGDEGCKSYCLGNSLKYLSRAGKKNKQTEKEDIKKAIWYLNYYEKI